MKKLIILTVFICSIFSCKNDVNLESNEIKLSHEPIKREITYNFDFPDTLYIDKIYDGVLKYESVLDTVTTEFGLKNENRYTRFITHIAKNNSTDVKYLKKVVKDTFGAIDNRTIPFYDIKFSETGVFYIQGLINDIIAIDLFTKDENGDDLVRLIEINEPVSHKVIVLKN